MGRFVAPQPSQAKLASGASPGDGLSGRVVKYIPAEFISLYVITINALAAVAPPGVNGQYVGIALMLAFTVATAAFIHLRAPKDQPDVVRKHLLVSPLSFVAWSYPLSAGLLGTLFIPWIAIVAQAIVLLLAAVVIPQE